MTKALILKAKQMKMRYCAIPCVKTIPKSDQTSTFLTFRARKSFERNGATFAGELTRSFSRRGKRNSRDKSDLKFPAKSPHVSYDVTLKDHDCIFPCKENKVSSSPTEKNINTVKESICFLPNRH